MVYRATVVIYILHGLGQVASLTRLAYRTRTRRLWWDDFWAFVAMAFDIIMVALWGTRYLEDRSNVDVMDIRRATAIISITSVLWAARLSIAVTIVRLVPLGPGRVVAKLMSVLFALMWCGLLVNKLFICQRGYGGTKQSCKLPIETGILELCTDITADVWLICSPAYLLWDVKLSHKRQILIFSVFASDILLAAASIVHCVYIIRQKRPNTSISAQIELGISLIICNLLVLVTWVYSRVYPPDREESSTDSTNYPTTTQAASRSRRVNAPRYGFDGSALVLTEMSTPSASIFSTSDNQSINSTYSRPWSKPRTHSLAALYPVIPMPRETLPSYLRPTKSCPALFHFAPLVTSEKVGNGCDEIKCKNIQFDARAVKRSPSFALSSDSGSWNPEQFQTRNGRGTLYKN